MFEPCRPPLLLDTIASLPDMTKRGFLQALGAAAMALGSARRRAFKARHGIDPIELTEIPKAIASGCSIGSTACAVRESFSLGVTWLVPGSRQQGFELPSSQRCELWRAARPGGDWTTRLTPTVYRLPRARSSGR